MKQVLQNLKSGETTLADVPAPIAVPGQMLIQTKKSLISAGTERMLVEFGKSNLLAKAKSQPDKVKQVLDKIKADGLLPTVETVFKRLDEPLPLGYCNAGVIEEIFSPSAVRSPQSSFKKGDRVISNGPHAEMVSAPYNLCAKIPNEVSDEEAAFTVLASIGLQGIRLAKPTIGEKIVVYGLGLIGLITVQILKANGCEVLGIDINDQRLEMAKRYGAEVINPANGNNHVVAAEAWTKGQGVDAVLITASAKTDDIVHQSAQMCRKRGRIVLVGVVGLNLNRADFYNKELTFQVSCSYGPGRYDESYEQKGQDYPFGFVRWTEQRNFEAILEMMRNGQLNVKELISDRIPFEQAAKAYELLSTNPQSLGIILEYQENKHPVSSVIEYNSVQETINQGAPVIGLIGAGNFSKMTLLPALAKTKARIRGVADLKGDAAAHLAKKYGAEQALTDYHKLLEDDAVNVIIISVGHQLHARLICESLEAGKHVFVEKPLAMNIEELQKIIEVKKKHLNQHIMVGFNRRFSPHIQKVKTSLSGRIEPLAMTMTVNAGYIPADHWVHDPVRGGGRIIGEACHFMDLMVYLCSSPVQIVAAVQMKGTTVEEDKMAMVLSFEDGSVGTINYFANGAKSYPKETLEVFTENRVIRVDNFKKTSGSGFSLFKHLKTLRPEKGHAEEFRAFVKMLETGGEPLIPFSELVNVSLASFTAIRSASENRSIELVKEYPEVYSVLL